MFITCFGRNSDDDNYDDSVSKMKAAEKALEAKQKVRTTCVVPLLPYAQCCLLS